MGPRAHAGLLGDLTRALRYRDADLPRLQDALSGWIAEAGDLGYCHVGDVAHRIYENLRGRHELGDVVRVWEGAAGAIVGFAICLRFGTAFDVFAAPSVRGTALEVEMLRTAAAITDARATEEWVQSDVWRGDAARAAALTGLGFEEYRTWDHITERSIDPDGLPAPRLPPGFVVRSVTVADAPELAAARNAAFAETWTGDQYRAEVMEKPGYDPQRELVVVAPDGRVAAFTVYWLDERNRCGLFEPVGTHPEFQRRGLARSLMVHGLRAMVAAGMTRAVVEHDATNAPAAALYAGLGFTIRYETLGFRRAATPRQE